MSTRVRCSVLIIGAMACCMATPPVRAQAMKEAILYNFCASTNCPDGSNPTWLVQGSDGNLYGVTETGGNSSNSGVAFRLNKSGELTVLHTFCSAETGSAPCADGSQPMSLVLANDGNFYGVTLAGGAYDSLGNSTAGTVFQLTPTGGFTTIYSFCSVEPDPAVYCPNGSNGSAPTWLLAGNDGYLYGVAETGGPSGGGTVFKTSTSGSSETLLALPDVNLDASVPLQLIQRSDGTLFGVTFGGGAYGYGTAFSISNSGVPSILYNFCCVAGAWPTGLTLGRDGDLYGDTYQQGGGFTSFGSGYGTVFNLSPAGVLTPLFTFCLRQDCSTGEYGVAPLLLANDGTFFGTTRAGGNDTGRGVVFQLDSYGVYQVVYDFCQGANSTQGCSDASGYSNGALVQGADGVIYGASLTGGANGLGAIYSLVPKSNAALALGAKPYPPSVGQSVVLSAKSSGSSSTPTGTVTFSSEGVTLCSVSLNSGSGTCSVDTASFSHGSFTIAAAYTGDSNYNSSTFKGTAVITMAPTATTLVIEPISVTPPAGVTLTVTVRRSAAGASGSPSGTVSILYGSDVLDTVTLGGSGNATVTLPTRGYSAGSYNITARYNGDADDSTSTAPAVAVTLH